MPTPPRLRIALVGAGAMGALHARVVTQSQDADLACVIDPDHRSAQDLSERFRAPWHSTLDDFSGIDAVIIATPTPTHSEHARRAIDAGVPVLVEKPLSGEVAETRSLVDLAHARGVPLTCGLLERFNPAVRTAMRIVDEPVHISTVRHSPYADRIRTGVAHDLLIHDVDLVLRLTGRRPTRVDARFAFRHPKSAPGAEDIADVVLAFGDDVLASLSVSRISQRKVRTLTIAELERLIEVDMVRNDVTVYRHVGASSFDDDGPGYRQQTIIDIPTVQDAREPLVVQLERFVALARGEVDASEELATLLGPHEVVADIARVAGEPS